MSNWWWFTKIATVKSWGIYVTEADDVTIGSMTSHCSAAFCPVVWLSKDQRLSTRYMREMDENLHKKTLIQVHFIWIPLIQVLLVWTPLIWKSTHGCLPYANQLMRSLLMRKLHLNSCEVFAWEIVSPQPQNSSHAKSFHLHSCEVFSCGTISTQPMRILLMWNHLIPTHVKPSHVKSSHPNSCEIFSCGIFSCEIFSCGIFSCEIFSCEIISCEIVSSQLMWSLLMWHHLNSTHANSSHVKSSHLLM